MPRERGERENLAIEHEAARSAKTSLKKMQETESWSRKISLGSRIPAVL